MDHTDHSYSTVADEIAVEQPRRPVASKAELPPRPARLSWLVLGIIALIYVGTCFAPVIFDDNEGLYAGSVREMHQSGDWLMPTVNGFPRVQKPPLVYWTMLVSTSVLGENEFALRLPNALATVGWIFATYLIMRRLGGERFGLASALVLSSMLGVAVLFNHLVQPEPFLACCISLAIWCLVEARHRPTPVGKWYLLFWMFLALGTMSKGLHGALWPLGTVLLTALFVPGFRPWLRPVLSARGALLFLAITMPWYAYMAARLPGFLAAHFLNEQLGASLNTRYPVDAEQLSLLQFYGQHFLFWMPWTLLLPAAIYVAVKRRKVAPERTASAASDIIGLLICWIALTFVSVAFSTRQDYYSMSSWGVVAAFLAMPFVESSSVRLPRPFVVVPSALVFFGGVAALACAAFVMPWLATLGDATAVPTSERNTFMNAIAGISPALWGRFITPLTLFGLAASAGGAFAIVSAWRRQNFPVLLLFSAVMGVTTCLATAGFSMMSPYFSLAGEARAINAELPATPDALVACEALPNTASSLYFYLNARVHWVNAPFRQDYAQRVLGEGRDFYWDDATLLGEWRSSHPVYLIIEETRLAYWQGQLPPGARVVNKSGTRMVLCNR